MSTTSGDFDFIIQTCKTLFLKKNSDYGTSWRVLRLASITDQIFIKAQRIRTLEEKKIAKINEDISAEYMGIINYCLIALIQLDFQQTPPIEPPASQVEILFDQKVAETKQLMFAKNHDYGEAWRSMRISSLTDLILMKLLRIKQIEDNEGQTLVSEGVKSNYQDIINYAVFALVKLSPPKN